METRLFPQSGFGGFESKEHLRRWLARGLKERSGIYYLAKRYKVTSNSIALFEMEGTIVGCAVVRKATREMTKEEQSEFGGDWKAAIELDPDSIWVWRREQDVELEEVGIYFLPGHLCLLLRRTH